MSLFDPTKPVKGMRTAVQPGGLPSGIFSNLQNIRFQNGQVTVRQGLKQLAAPPTLTIAGGSNYVLAHFCGAWAGYVAGTFTILVAWRWTWDAGGAHAQTFIYSLDPNAFTWTNLSQEGNGRNPVTVFNDPGNVVFQPIHDQTGIEIVVMQNGVDYPLIYDPSQSSGNVIAQHQPVAPTAVQTYSALLQFAHTIPIWEYGSRNDVTYYNYDSGTITAATNVSPIAVTFTGAEDYATGTYVAISGALGNTAANGVWYYTRTGTRTGTLTYLLGPNAGQNSAGNGVWTSGGTINGLFAFADSGLGLELTATLVVNQPAQLGGNYADIVFGNVGGSGAGVVNLTTSSQLILIFSTPFYGAFGSISISAMQTGNTIGQTLIWLPVNPGGGTPTEIQPVYLPGIDPLDPNCVMVGFDLTQFAGSTDPNITNCGRLRLQYIASVPPQNFYVEIEMIALSGNVPGQPQYGIAWQNSASRAESYGQILTNVQTSTLQRSNSSPSSGLQLPNSPLFYYETLITVQDVASAQISAGVDTLRVYRQDYGEVQFTLADSIVVNPWSGTAWPTANAGTQITNTDSTASASKDFSQIMPDAYHVPIPIGSSMTRNNTRLYVGGVNSATTNEVWVSDSTSAVKFRSIVRFLAPNVVDPTSPARNAFPGELVTALWQSPGSYVGVSPVYVFTNRSVWRLDGLDATALNRPTRVNLHGCPFSGTIAEYYGDIYWVDIEREVRSLARGSMLSYTKFKVDNLIINGSLANASAAVMQDRYYLAYQPAGQSSNTNVLIYETLLGEWCQDLPGNGNNYFDAAGLLTIDDSTLRKVYQFSKFGYVYQVEATSQTVDGASTGIVVVMSSAELHAGMWKQVNRRRCCIVTDPALETLAISSVWQPGSAQAQAIDGTINLANMPAGSGYSRTRLWESGAYSGNPVSVGGTGLSLILTMTGTLPGGLNIYEWGVEFWASDETRGQVG